MKVLVLSNMYPPHSHGGYELWCQDVLRRWVQAGHEALVLTSDHRLAESGLEGDPAIEVRRVLQLYWADHVMLDPSIPSRLRRERANLQVLDRALEEFSPGVVTAWAMGAMSFGLLARVEDRGIPLLSVVCDEWPVYGPEVDAWSRLFASRPRIARIVRGATGLPCRLPNLDEDGQVCFVSRAMEEKVRRLSRWTFADSVVVPSGVDLSEFDGGGPEGAGPERTWAWRVLHVGRIDPRKGLDTVVEAFAACPPEARLDLLGSGDDRYLGELRAAIDRLGLGQRVSFGNCGRHELAARYRAADVVVFAPIWDEPFGLVPLEAMACGTPVVASPTGGSSEFLTDGLNCLTFPSGDAQALRESLLRLAEDQSLRRRLVANGLQTVARYDADRVAAELEGWLERVGARRLKATSEG